MQLTTHNDAQLLSRDPKERLSDPTAIRVRGLAPFSFVCFVLLRRLTARSGAGPSLLCQHRLGQAHQEGDRPALRSPRGTHLLTRTRERTIIVIVTITALTPYTTHTAHACTSHNKQKSELSTDMIDPSFTGEDATLSVTDNVR
jgi:hypothetical protein